VLALHRRELAHQFVVFGLDVAHQNVVLRGHLLAEDDETHEFLGCGLMVL